MEPLRVSGSPIGEVFSGELEGFLNCAGIWTVWGFTDQLNKLESQERKVKSAVFIKKLWNDISVTMVCNGGSCRFFFYVWVILRTV